jgi:hypothetical protein
MSSQYIFNDHDTPRLKVPPAWVTVTHPHHPLHGQKLEVVRFFGSKYFLVRRPDGGGLAQISQSWTDYGGEQYQPHTGGSDHLLDIDGLRDIVKIIAQLVKEAGSLKKRTRLRTSRDGGVTS